MGQTPNQAPCLLCERDVAGRRRQWTRPHPAFLPVARRTITSTGRTSPRLGADPELVPAVVALTSTVHPVSPRREVGALLHFCSRCSLVLLDGEFEGMPEGYSSLQEAQLCGFAQHTHACMLELVVCWRHPLWRCSRWRGPRQALSWRLWAWAAAAGGWHLTTL